MHIEYIRIQMNINTKKPFSVRFDDPTTNELIELSRHSGVSVAKLIRVATEALLKHTKANGGLLVFPLNFDKFYMEVKKVPKDIPKASAAKVA